MKGLCQVCYSSGVFLVCDEDFEAKCEKCKHKNSLACENLK